MNGIINVLKPPGMTSFDVVAWLRGVLKVKKVGHLGTLDPGAAGVLPVCVGSATGVSPYVSEFRKRYKVEAVTGLLTDTQDTFGSVLERGDDVLPGYECFERVLESFMGRQNQIPPMYSAVKVGGQRLYSIARRGGTSVERVPRQIEIFSLGIVSYGETAVVFDVECSQGTYIRTLVQDIGERLGIRLCMSFLLRTMSAGLTLAGANTLEHLETIAGTRLAGAALAGAWETGNGSAATGLAGAALTGETLAGVMLPTDTLLSGYRAVILRNHDAKRQYINGVTLPPEAFDAGHRENNTPVTVPYVAVPHVAVPPTAEPHVAVPHVAVPHAVRVYGDGGFIGMGLLLECGNPAGLMLRAKKTFIGAFDAK